MSGLDVRRMHHALLAAGESELRYAIDEGKYLEAASLIVTEYDRLRTRDELDAQIADNFVETVDTLRLMHETPGFPGFDHIVGSEPEACRACQTLVTFEPTR